MSITRQAADRAFMAGRKNLLINGCFRVWQRGTSFTAPNGYTADRFNCATAGTISRQAFTVGQTDVPGEPEFFLRMATTSATAANSVAQKVENVRTLAGRTVTLSFWAKADAAVILDVVRARQNFGSGGSADVSDIGLTSINLTTSWQRFVLQFILPSISGKTVGNNSYTMFEIRKDTLQFTLDIAQIQLEEGPIATAFEDRPIGEEASLCQRYCLPFKLNFRSLATAAGQLIYVNRSVPSAMRDSDTATVSHTVTASSGWSVYSSQPPMMSGPTDFLVGFVASGASGNGYCYIDGIIDNEL